jgi:hypothetical protein
MAHLRDEVLHRRGVILHNEKEVTGGEPVWEALMPKLVFEGVTPPKLALANQVELLAVHIVEPRMVNRQPPLYK